MLKTIYSKQIKPYVEALKGDKYFWWTIITIILGAIIAGQSSLLLLGLVAFIQNMAFTASSRSRNSANPEYHYRVAFISNGVWFLTNFFLILDNVKSANWFHKLITMLVYTAATSYGSMIMMKIMLKKETGKNQVGARS